jgi:hypothetical protein
MTCPFCIAVFEAADSQYVSHILAEHPQAQLSAGIGFLALPLLFKGRASQLIGAAGITFMALLFVRSSLR